MNASLKTETIKFSVTADEKDKIYALAEQKDLSVSAFVRQTIFEKENTQTISSELQWKKASISLSKTALIVYLLVQENGPAILSPSKIEQLGFMAKGTASKAIKELEREGFLDGSGYPVFHEEEKQQDGYSIYKLSFPNGYTYIGITAGKAETRWQNGNGYKNNREMFSAISQYGWENIQKEVVYSNLTQYEANRKESELIQKYSLVGPVYNKAKLPQ